MMTDIDHFKKFNDTYGHLTGDQVLRLVAMSVKQNVKGQDIAARYGGEEFAIVLPNTVLRSAITVADHIRRAVMTKELMKRSTGEHLGRVTISIGVAALRPGDTPQSLIERADTCLYAAKRCGRNRVICETDPEAASRRPKGGVGAHQLGRLRRRSAAGELHRLAAAAGRGLVRIVEHELRRQLVDLVVHLGAEQEQHAFGSISTRRPCPRPPRRRRRRPRHIPCVGHAGAAAVLDADAHAGDRVWPRSPSRI